MKLVWMGNYQNEEQLDKGNLPEDAVMFKEPDDPLQLQLAASIFIIPTVIFIVLMFALKSLIVGGMSFARILQRTFNLIGIILSFLTVIPHEFLHAIAFPKEAEVTMWVAPQKLIAFVHSVYPVSKIRFIFLSFLPSLVFGVLPLIVWIFIPAASGRWGDIISSFGVFSLLMGIGDFMNIYNAATQMPKNSVTQLSGFHSYWYMPR